MTNYLYHHGILGQKWGKRNGPPYPLDPKTDYSKAEQRAISKKLKKIRKSKISSGEKSKKAQSLVESTISESELKEFGSKHDEWVISQNKMEAIMKTKGTDNSEYISAKNDASNAFHAYINACEEVSNRILGAYKDKGLDRLTYDIYYREALFEATKKYQTVDFDYPTYEDD